jgi:hypothetical protein
MRKTLKTVTLVLVLSCPAFAGIMHTPGSPTPPAQPEPTPMTTVQEPTDGTTLNGEMHTPGIMHNPGVSGSLAEVALDLLAILPSIL